MTSKTMSKTHLRSLLSSLLLTLFSFSSVIAAQPVISQIEPTGINRGGEHKVTFVGTRLKDAREVLLYEPGFTVKEVKPAEDNTKAEVTFLVAPECRIGMHAVQLITSTGVANLRLLAIGNLPEIAEVEPNGEFAAPQGIQLNHTITGVIPPEDEDFFAVDLKAGQRVVVEVEGVRTWAGSRNDFFDPFVAVLDSNRYEIAVADDVPLLHQDPVTTFTVPADGRYIIQIRESSYGGAGDYFYRMHVGVFPRPMAVIPSGGKPSEVVTAKFIEADGATIERQVQLPSETAYPFPLTLEKDGLFCPSPNMVRVSEHNVVLEREPNNDNKTPTVGVMPVAFSGVIGQAKDEDWFEFEAKNGQKFNVQCYARKILRSPLDSVVNVYGPEYQGLAGNDDSGGPDSFVTITAAADGMHRVRITDHLQKGGPIFAYRLEVTPVQPSLTLTLPEIRRDEPVSLVVPRGGRMAVMVNAARQEFGGELTITAGNLPAGATSDPIVMRADQSTVPVLVRAAADAPLAAGLATLAGKPVADQPVVVCKFDMRHKLVRGANNTDVFGYDSDRMNMAVTDASPIEITVEPPKVPVVRNGSMNLKVKITRPETFKEAVPLRFLYNPPGIGSSASVSVAADKTEAEIPLTANASAVMGTWPIIVIASVNVGNGSIELASEPIMLEIADAPFVFEFPKTSAEQGAKSQTLVRVTVNRQLDGPAEIELVGVPAGVTLLTPKLPVTQETVEVVFPLEIAADARVGQHNTLNCKATIHAPGGDIVETVGTGMLQIDQPIPQAKPPEAPKPVVVEAPVVAAPPVPPKPLTRLEQLRKARETGQ